METAARKLISCMQCVGINTTTATALHMLILWYSRPGTYDNVYVCTSVDSVQWFT